MDFSSVSLLQIVLVMGVTLIASVIGGVAGYGTGLLLPPVLLPVIGPEAVVPVIGLSSLLTNLSRLWVYREDFDRSIALRMMIFALPTTILGAWGYALLTGPQVAILIGLMLIVLVPVRHYLKTRAFVLKQRGLTLASVGYGALVGGTAGSGVVLMSILLGAGLSGGGVIATDAAISFVLGAVKSGTFFVNGELPLNLIIIALLIGLLATPGAFIAKRLALKLSGNGHIYVLDAAVILGGILMIVRGISG